MLRRLGAGQHLDAAARRPHRIPMVEERFPFEAARDLLGLLRAMYASAISRGALPERLAQIASVARDLKEARHRAAMNVPSLTGYAAAIATAEGATERACRLVDQLTPAEPIVTAARQRVHGNPIVFRKKAPEG